MFTFGSKSRDDAPIVAAPAADNPTRMDFVKVGDDVEESYPL